MLVVADLGNSRLKLGAFDGARLVAVESVEGGEVGGVIPFPQAYTADELVVGCSAPARLPALLAALGRPVRVLGPETVAAVPTSYRDPARLGLDRVAATFGARAELGVDEVVVADVGTAVTVDALDARGTFLAVAIAAGPAAAAEGLLRRAPHLPAVPHDGPPRTPATSTEESLRAGALLGTAGMVERLLDAACALVGAGAVRVLTGGAAAALSPHVRRDHVVRPHAVLHGLRVLHALVPA